MMLGAADSEGQDVKLMKIKEIVSTTSRLTQYISTYTIGQKYISVYVEIYDYTCNSVYVRISQYEILRLG